MNELKFLEVMGKIDNELIREADINTAEQPKTMRLISKRSIYAFGSVAAVAAIAVCSALLFNSYNPSKPQDNSTPQSTESQPSKQTPDTPSVKGYYKPFSATIDPDVDSFSEDELHHIDIRTSVGFYHQLTLDEYTSNGISSTISTTDFGEFIGKIIEVNDYDYHGNAAESQEPTLAGAEVYYYAPKENNKAFIIVKQNDQCSIFISDDINTSEGYQAGLSFFNVQSAEDIESIEYQKYVPDDNGEMIISEKNVITDI